MPEANRPDTFRDHGRAVIVGASLAGLRAAEALRAEGFAGTLTIIGDEAAEPYDRPPLSKMVLSGVVDADDLSLPVTPDLAAEWILGTAATSLNPAARVVTLADGRHIPYDRLLICTGTRPRPWADPAEGALEGVFVLRTHEDGRRLRARLEQKPHRVLIVGGGFIGCEVASICRDLDLDVTLAERGGAPLASALGGRAGVWAADLQRRHGVDLRLNTTVLSLEGEDEGKLVGARLSDGDRIAIDTAVIALGAVRNVEWLDGAGLAVDHRGVACDATCRVFDANGMLTDDIFVAGDVSRWPLPLYDGQFLSVEHWNNAVEQGRAAAHNMACDPAQRRPHAGLPRFWSHQFDLVIKSIGLPTAGDQIIITEGSQDESRFVAVYGKDGKVVAAVAVDSPRALEAYVPMIEQAAAFPPQLHASDAPDPHRVESAGFPPAGTTSHGSSGAPTGPGPSTSASSPADDPREPAGSRAA